MIVIVDSFLARDRTEPKVRDSENRNPLFLITR